VLFDYGKGVEGAPKIFDLICVIDDVVWNRLGRPPNVRAFRPGYWSTLSGERWSGMLSKGNFPELLGLRRELLPAEPGAPPDRGGD
jgi:hypothetical protein